MTQLKYNKIDEYLASNASEDNVPDLFFLWGHQYLVGEKSKRIVDKLLKGRDRNLALEEIDGEAANAAAVIDTVSTMNPFLDIRVVWAKNLPLFSRKPGWGYAKEEVKRLARFIEKGIPGNTRLIVTSESCDKRSVFFKTAAEKGVVVDCTVPQGARKSDLNEQTMFLRHTAEAVLTAEGKKLDKAAFQKLVDLTGFDPDTFADNLKKLASYTGDRAGIKVKDVDAVASRTKKDPIFEFTNAVCDKDLESSLFYLNSLESAGFHPLQILKALTNQIRKLFAAGCFIEHQHTGNTSGWTKGQDFNTFKQKTVPAIQAYETRISEKTREWGKTTDLLILSNPNNPYPVYQTLKKADNFSVQELKTALSVLGDIDHDMKSSAVDPGLLIKNFIVTICSKGG
ncbi:MAG: hypothetical protein K9J83_01605 [Desulfarculaceae bacterium]|nr:hypothetical protein [Desulfarculaceae bacterium]